MKKVKYFHFNDEIFVLRMLKTKVIFYFYSDSYTDLIKSQVPFSGIFCNCYQVFVSEIVRSNVQIVNSEINSFLQIIKTLDEGNTSEAQYARFYTARRAFHLEAINFPLNNFSLENDFLKHDWFLDFQDRIWSLESVLRFIEYYSSHFNFTPEQLSEIEEEYIQLVIISIDDFSKEAFTEAIIRIGGDDEDNVTYRIYAFWWYLYQIKIPGTPRSKFHYLLNTAKLVLSVIYSRAVE